MVICIVYRMVICSVLLRMLLYVHFKIHAPGILTVYRPENIAN
jgi:hypothetical protein